MLKRQLLKMTGLNQRREWKSAPIGLIPPDQYRASTKKRKDDDKVDTPTKILSENTTLNSMSKS